MLAEYDGLQEDGFGSSEQDRDERPRHGAGPKPLDIVPGETARDMVFEELMTLLPAAPPRNACRLTSVRY